MDLNAELDAAAVQSKKKKSKKHKEKKHKHGKHKSKKEPGPPIDYLRKQKFSIVTSELFRQLRNLHRKSTLAPDEFPGEHAERLGEFEGEGYVPKFRKEYVGEGLFEGERPGEVGLPAELLGELDSDAECQEIPGFYYDEDGKRVDIMRIGSQIKISNFDLKKLLMQTTAEAKEDETEKLKLEIIPEEIHGEDEESEIVSELSVQEIPGEEDSELDDLDLIGSGLGISEFPNLGYVEPEPDETRFYYDEKGNRVTLKRTGSRTKLSRKFLDSLIRDASEIEQSELEETESEEGFVYSRPHTASIGGLTGESEEEAGEDHPFISLIDKYAQEYGGEDDDNYRVGVVAEVKETPSSTKKVKMYNVALQVRPKDIFRALRKVKPKMYNVSIGVTIREDEKLEAQRREQEKLEKDQAELAKIKRKDEILYAKPRGYKELDLKIGMEPEVATKEAQVTDMDIERELAASLGLKIPVNNIIWPTIRDFSPELIELRLETYIDRVWKLDKEWVYNIRYLQHHTTNFRHKHIFEVMFSIPTMSNPVPIATASVYFVFEIGHYANLNEQIKVTYILESTRFPFVPGRFPFQQKWLSGIIADKIRIQKSFRLGN